MRTRGKSLDRHGAAPEPPLGGQARVEDAPPRPDTRQLSDIVESLEVVIWSAAPDGGAPQFLNPAVESLYGRPAGDFNADPELWIEMVHPEDRAAVRRLQGELLRTGAVDYEHRIVRSDGRVRHVRTRARLMRGGPERAARIDGVSTDITALRERQVRIERLEGLYTAISSMSAMTANVRDRDALFRDACRIAVEHGSFRFAWIGLVDRVGALRPLAHCGVESGFLDVVAAAVEAGLTRRRGPVMSALLEGRPYVCNDVEFHPLLPSWRAAALERGYRAFASLPLRVSGRTAGCFNVYASEAHRFEDDALHLLEVFAGSVSCALELIARDERLDYLAYYDPVTRLANRQLFSERVEQFLAAARRGRKRMAMLVADIDHFKAINDTLGTSVGDTLLRRVAARMKCLAGDAQRLGRIVGDEFGLIVPDLDSQTDLMAVFRDHAWQQFARPFRVHGRPIGLSAKIGIAMFPDDGDSAGALFRNAEAALKRAKATGERYLFYTATMSATIRERLDLEHHLREVVARRQLVLYYQPKVDLRLGTICGAEALVRWNSPELGLVLPDRFMAVLEEMGLMAEVWRWALQQALADRRRWIEDGLPPVAIALNVSPRQLAAPDFVDTLDELLSDPNNDAAGLQLEVTESTLMQDIERYVERLSALRERGIELAIDDFGTGYSSLAYLMKLPVGIVKIDRSFTDAMVHDADTMSIVGAVVSLAHSLRRLVVAEGVETTEQLQMLRSLGCDQMQGFLFSKAVPADAFAQLLRSGAQLS